MKRLLYTTLVLIFLVSGTIPAAQAGSAPCLASSGGPGYATILQTLPLNLLFQGASGLLADVIRLASSGLIISANQAEPVFRENVPAPAQPAAVDPARAMENEMLGYINAERAKVNAPALVLDQNLCSGAYLKSKDMAENGYFNHVSPTYGSPFDMMKSLGISFRAAGENIAMFRTVKAAHDGFMNSPGHKANILSTRYNKVGLGFYQKGYHIYITQWFTN